MIMNLALCERCGKVTSADEYHLSDSGKYLCFGCLCVVNPLVALEVLREAEILQDAVCENTSEREVILNDEG